MAVCYPAMTSTLGSQMPNFADSLREEIARVARRELKEEFSSLRKASTAHRGEIAALKRDIKNLASQNRSLARQLKAASGGRSALPAAESEMRKKPGRQVVYTPERFFALRKRLGVTQAQMALLVGASSLSVSKWERGDVEPRQAQKTKILALRSLGKREAAKLLAAAE